MGKWRRGGFVFLTWAGDPSAQARARLSRRRPGGEMGPRSPSGDEGCGFEAAHRADPGAGVRGLAVKIRSVSANNRKRAFEVSTTSKVFTFPFVKADPAPAPADPIVQVFVDDELGREGFTYVLASGREGSVHVEQVLEYNQDPGYLRQLLLYRLTLEAERRVAESGCPSARSSAGWGLHRPSSIASSTRPTPASRSTGCSNCSTSSTATSIWWCGRRALDVKRDRRPIVPATPGRAGHRRGGAPELPVRRRCLSMDWKVAPSWIPTPAALSSGAASLR